MRDLRPGPDSLGRAGKRGVRTPGLCLPEAAAVPTWEGVGAQLSPEAGRREPRVSARPGSCQAALHLHQEGRVPHSRLLPPPGQLAGLHRKPAKPTARGGQPWKRNRPVSQPVVPTLRTPRVPLRRDHPPSPPTVFHTESTTKASRRTPALTPGRTPQDWAVFACCPSSRGSTGTPCGRPRSPG